MKDLSTIIGAGALIILFVCLSPLVLMILWNNFIVDFLPVKGVNFFQACAMIAVSYILIKPAK